MNEGNKYYMISHTGKSKQAPAATRGAGDRGMSVGYERLR